MSDARQTLLDDVYVCAKCDARTFGFELAGPEAGYYKFPATIGARAAAPVLFVGINPRRSASNARLHQDVMRSPEAFKTLAGNRIPDAHGRPTCPYIKRGGVERHYELHMEIVESAFGIGARFEDYAAVTELLLCATVSSPPVDLTTSPCAKEFLARTVDQVRPEVIVAVGTTVDNYFRSRTTQRGGLVLSVAIGRHNAWLIPVPHPNARGVSSQMRRFAAKTTGRWIKEILDTGAPSERPPFLGSIANGWTALSGQAQSASASVRRPPIIAEPGASYTPPGAVDRGALTGRWRALLAPLPIPQTGRTLAAHPDATALTQRLVKNLTLERLILLANVEHNRCRPSQLAELSPYDRSRDPELAWKLLEHGMATMQMRQNTAWMRTIDLLRPGADAGLAIARKMPIGPLIGLCERIISGPYREAC
ncbi:MAG TPA: uracil-DNA glycosylase family protein [Solirubrobacteraceae bacterium]|nr:uracil-DNA glycosylase family protein [Solirubrobacteraceae bacterium]